MPTAQMRTDATLTEVLDALPVPYLNHTEPDSARGFAFEELLLYWFAADPVMSAVYEKAQPWSEWASENNLDPVDLGIDLVLTDTTGSHTAVQAKCYAEHNEVTTAGVDSFLARALGVSASHGVNSTMLVATTDRIAKNGRRKLEEAGTTVVSRYALEESDVQWGALYNAAFCGQEAPEPAPKRELRPYQEAAVSDVVDKLAETDRTQLIAACGTGKTLMGLRIAEAFTDAELVVVATPSIALTAQTAQGWVADAHLPFSTLVVCSDHTAGSSLRNKKEADANSKAVDAEILSSVPVPVTTNAERVAEFLKTPGRKVIFTTHISSPRVIEAMQQTNTEAGFLLVDEAHKIAGRSQAGPVLCFELPAKKRLFTTATPRVITGVKGGDRRYTTMDNVEQFGEEAHTISFADAVELGALVDYEIRIVVITDEDVRASLEEADYVELANGTALLPTEYATQVAIQKHAAELGLERVVSFHSTKREARAFAESYRLVADTSAGNLAVTSETLTGDNPVRERTAALKRLRDLESGSGEAVDQFLMTNARCLTEGIDVVSIDTVVFASTKRSTTDIVQAAGRAMRLSPTTEKTKATIMLPLHLAPSSVDEIEVSEWEPVVSVLRAMGSADERLVDAMELAQRAQVRRAVGLSTGGWENTLADLVKVSGTRHDVLGSVSSQVLERVTGTWNARLEELALHVTEHGSAPGRLEGPLGRWVNAQRVAYRRGQLSADRTRRLEATDGWVWDAHEALWCEQFAALEAFVATHGRVPGQQDGPVGVWVNNQRAAHRKGKQLNSRIERLETIEGWVWDVQEAAWQTQLQELHAYVNTHSTLPSPKEGPLYTWVWKQRSVYNDGKLTTERTARLEAVTGWRWSAEER